MTPRKSRISRRWKIRALLFAAALPASLVLYAALVEPAWVEVTVHSIHAETGGAPIVIAQLSDLHLRQIGRTENRVIEKIHAIDPDLLVLSGDAVDHPTALAHLDVFLGRLGPMLKIAVLGNWEHWSGIDLEELKSLYSRHQVQLLINERADLFLQGQTLSVIGLDDATAGWPDPARALEGAVAPGLLVIVQHSPAWFEDQPIQKHPELPALFCLSGHTHGGQLALFNRSAWTPWGSGSFRRGWYRTPFGPLYVSRGIGTSILPLRFGSKPEIAVFRLE